MEEIECPHCLGCKTVWNGIEFEDCIRCNGTGEIIYEETDIHLLVDEEDFIEFDEDKHSIDNNEDDTDS